MKKNDIIFYVFALCVIGFLLPFVVSSDQDSLIAVLSLSFTAVASIATGATFVIAVYLFDRFGIEGKFVAKQTDKVLELVDLLKGKTITAQGDVFKYFIRPSLNSIETLTKVKSYQADRKKIIIVSDQDYTLWAKDIFALKRSYWMPTDIKRKLEFIDFYGLNEIENLNYNTYIALDFHLSPSEDLLLPLPEMTFEDFNGNLSDLIKEIEDWLGKYSSIPIDFKMEEPEK
jgi:hypothetical protein